MERGEQIFTEKIQKEKSSNILTGDKLEEEEEKIDKLSIISETYFPCQTRQLMKHPGMVRPIRQNIFSIYIFDFLPFFFQVVFWLPLSYPVCLYFVIFLFNCFCWWSFMNWGGGACFTLLTFYPHWPTYLISISYFTKMNVI